MIRSIVLKPDERQELLDIYRKHHDPEVRFRAHILLLLDEGRSWQDVGSTLYCSSRTIDRWVKRFQHDGIAGLGGRKRGRPFRFSVVWIRIVVAMVTRLSPRHFGSLRSRWTCATVALALHMRFGLRVSRETVRRWLRCGDMVYRRPRPVLGPRDPHRQAKLAALRRILARLPADETAVWQDEVDINTNPEIGRMWMRRGVQAHIPTPGTNRKRYVAGSIHWRTGRVFATDGPRRDSGLFLEHLDELRRRLRRYRKIHVICDNAKFHLSKDVQTYLWTHRDRIELELLPAYSPDANPVERVWWFLREHVTRNHRCRDQGELLEMVFSYLESESPFRLKDAEYEIPKAA
jgi:putative transposase